MNTSPVKLFIFCAVLITCELTNVPIFAQPFHIVKATEQITAGGAAGMGSTALYTITLVAQKPSAMLHFDKLWVAGHFVKPEATKKALLNPTAAFGVNDTVVINAVYRQAGEKNIGGAIVHEQ